MKTILANRPRRRRQTVTLRISSSRWLAYATAGAATAFAGASSAEADITYSGPINAFFSAPAGTVGPPGQIGSFQLAAAGNSLVFQQFHYPNVTLGNALFVAYGLVGQGFAGYTSMANGNVYGNAYKLSFGAAINSQKFVTVNRVSGYADVPGYLAAGNAYGQWRGAGTGFLGFEFNNGGGMQYGWARVTMDGAPGNTFTVVDYAYGGIGEMISAGQVPEPGSLGLLALGGAGLIAWRQRRASREKIASL